MLKRHKPMNPGKGFKAKAPPPPRPVKTYEVHTPRVRPMAVPAAPAANACTFKPAPKFTYLRDTRYQAACRALPCQAPGCDAAGPDAGVTWAHSNQAIHGHGRSVKASDQFVAALCHTCHVELDQGKATSRAAKVALWNEAHRRTVALASDLGLWPIDYKTLCPQQKT